MKKDVFTLLGGFLTALLMFFGTINVQFDWFTQDSISAFVLLTAAFVALVVNLFAVWKNTHVTEGLKDIVLRFQGLKKK